MASSGWVTVTISAPSTGADARCERFAVIGIWAVAADTLDLAHHTDGRGAVRRPATRSQDATDLRVLAREVLDTEAVGGAPTRMRCMTPSGKIGERFSRVRLRTTGEEPT